MAYHYKMCGLDYVFLHGGVRKHETEYGKGVSIEHADALDRRIVLRVITSHSRMRGQEVRFLRSLMHLSQTEVANQLGIKRLTVARWEGSPNTPIPGPADRVLRLWSARVIFDDLECVGYVMDTLPEIADKKVEPLHMVYSPDLSANENEPGLFQDQDTEDESEGWKLKANTG